MYPAPYGRVNLLAMQQMIREFKYPVGYSDHTLGIETPIAAVALGAKIIEKHFTLNCAMEGPDHRASIEPHALTSMVKAIRNVEQALGKPAKEPCREEVRIMQMGRRSAISAHNLKKGQILKAEDIVVKRPGTGIPPKYIENILGRSVLCDIAKDSPIQYSHIEGT